MKPLLSRVESFVAGLILGMLLAWSIAPAHAEGANGIEHWGGVTLGSRHFTADNERYCESNPGVFYERRWADGTRGFHVGYYRNSFCKAERDDRIDDTFYALYIYQPWRVWGWQAGGFAGPASGYRKGNLTLLAGGLLTHRLTKDTAVQIIVNPAVAGLQLKIRF
jgi:hypothetical protein